MERALWLSGPEWSSWADLHRSTCTSRHRPNNTETETSGCLRTIDTGHGTRSGRRHGAWHIERCLNCTVSSAANGQLSEVATVEDIGPLPAAGADLDHVQGLMNLGPTQPETDDRQIPFIAKLFAAAHGKSAANLLNLSVLCSWKRRCCIARTEFGAGR